MTYNEKRAWAYGVVAVLVPAVYFPLVMARASSVGVADVDYVWLLIGAIGASLLLNALLAPRPGRTDARDREIFRRGVCAAFFVMSALSVVPLVLAMLEAAHFWIANSVYLAFVLSAVTTSATQVHAYRRGL